MLFRRRTPPTHAERLRVALWPRESWSRSFRYFAKRVLRLSATPHAIAAGFACGVVVSWTPFVGFHFLMSVILAFFIGGNMLAAVFGTAVGNPLTFPFMWWASHSLGYRILGLGGVAAPGEAVPPPHHFNLFDAPWAEVMRVLRPMLVGAVPLGVVSGLIVYFIVRFAVTAYQGARRRRLATRRAATAGSAASES